ncbi:MAG: HAD family hydrolase [Candidatus Aminicenantes bacterium]|nr:HAD family hydrolase [Candidatus Aminicenantes bacterium]
MSSFDSKAVFLDRDGTLIEDKGYICDFTQVTVFPFSVAAVRLLNDNNFKVIVITNQSAVARGICSEQQVQELHRSLTIFFSEKGVVIDDFYYCPYHEEGVIEKFRKKHECRKPAPGMILQAAADHGIDLERSFFIGDNECDILAGANAGCRPVLVLTGKGEQVRGELEQKKIEPYLIAPDLLSAVQKIAN